MQSSVIAFICACIWDCAGIDLVCLNVSVCARFCIHFHLCAYIYIYIYVCVCVCVCVRERERGREKVREFRWLCPHVGVHIMNRFLLTYNHIFDPTLHNSVHFLISHECYFIQVLRSVPFFLTKWTQVTSSLSLFTDMNYIFYSNQLVCC